MRLRSRPTESGSADARRLLREWLERPRYEVLPVGGVVDEIAAHLPVPTTITVTVTAKRGTATTMDCATQLAALGHRAIPHLAARQLRDEVELKELADRLEGVGIEDVFVVAGDVEQPAGEYAGAVDLIEALGRIAPRLRVGVAGYPESHPKIPDDVTVQAMWDKRHRASYVVGQLCFDPETVTAWIVRVRRRGVGLPLLAGVPGPVSTGRLLRIGTRIGVGSSLRFLGGHTGMLRVAGAGTYRPDDLLTGLAAASAAAPPEQRADGVHLYTFNQVAATEQWRRDLLTDLEEGAA